MARPLRIEFEGAVYHITSRGNAGKAIFQDDDDRELFLETVGKVVERFGWRCHAYCLMNNHYHLLVETPAPTLSRGMQYLNGVYTQSFNRTHRRSGHVFQGRFKAILVEKESHLLELARYIILNPVRVGLTRSARDWRWCSYRATAGQVESPEFLTTDWILACFDEDREGAIHAYRRFVRAGRDTDVWQDLRAGCLLGTDSFVEKLRPLIAEIPVDPHILRREATVARPVLDELLGAVKDKETRDLQIHAAVRLHHYTLQEVADHLGLHYSTISVIASRADAEIQE